jgi:hypothetical protein
MFYVWTRQRSTDSVIESEINIELDNSFNNLNESMQTCSDLTDLVILPPLEKPLIVCKSNDK